MKKSFSLFFILCSLFFFSQISEQKLDELIQKTITTFDVPGMSVGVLKDGKVIYSKGFGVRSLTSKLPMTPETLVGIASNSKGFTCTALAILADEGKLDWDDKVTKFLPDFKMYDDYVTREITIKDLVTHRAGLGLGQGDLMFFPEGGNISTEQLIHNVRYLKPAHSFRNTMDYNNIMFIVAGEIIHKISGKTWAEFIEERIMKPVGMTASFGSFENFKKQFSDAGAKQFGSGWAWLVTDASGKLKVGSTANQDNPLMPGMSISGTPVLAMDVWEHAYYLKYQNKRADYIEAFFNVIDWNVASDYYEKAMK